jgi:hypothetical protein
VTPGEIELQGVLEAELARQDLSLLGGGRHHQADEVVRQQSDPHRLLIHLG